MSHRWIGMPNFHLTFGDPYRGSWGLSFSLALLVILKPIGMLSFLKSNSPTIGLFSMLPITLPLKCAMIVTVLIPLILFLFLKNQGWVLRSKQELKKWRSYMSK